MQIYNYSNFYYKQIPIKNEYNSKFNFNNADNVHNYNKNNIAFGQQLNKFESMHRILKIILANNPILSNRYKFLISILQHKFDNIFCGTRNYSQRTFNRYNSFQGEARSCFNNINDTQGFRRTKQSQYHDSEKAESIFDDINDTQDFSHAKQSQHQDSEKAENIFDDINDTQDFSHAKQSQHQDSEKAENIFDDSFQAQSNQKSMNNSAKSNEAKYTETKINKEKELDKALDLFAKRFNSTAYSQNKELIASALELNLTELERLYSKNKKLYHTLCLKFHPDRNKSLIAQKQFILLNKIYKHN